MVEPGMRTSESEGGVCAWPVMSAGGMCIAPLPPMHMPPTCRRAPPAMKHQHNSMPENCRVAVRQFRGLMLPLG
jgi:hypothetical protein